MGHHYQECDEGPVPLCHHSTALSCLTATCQLVYPATGLQSNYSVISSNKNVHEPEMTPWMSCFAIFHSLRLNWSKGHSVFRPFSCQDSWLDSVCLWNLSGGDGDCAAQCAHCHDEQHIPVHPGSLRHRMDVEWMVVLSSSETWAASHELRLPPHSICFPASSSMSCPSANIEVGVHFAYT